MLIASLCIHHFDELLWLRRVFEQYEIFFHEISHGYMALAVGGTVSEFEMAITSGQVIASVPVNKAYLVSLAGYFGASLFGLLLFLSSKTVFVKVAKAFIIMSSLYWLIFSADWLTAGILVGIMLSIVLAWFGGVYGIYAMRFVGTYVMMSSIYSPVYLFSIGERGDHVNLVNLTGMPAWFYICIWMIFGAICLSVALRVSWSTHKSGTINLPEPVTV